MSELIERQKVLDLVTTEHPQLLDADALYMEIENLPPAQPQRIRGHWIDEGQYAEGHSHHAYRCSKCGKHIIELEPDDFCKYCGADMRGDENERPD